VIVDLGTRKASVLSDEPTARYTATSTLVESMAAQVQGLDAQATRAVVETLRHSGGLAPRALLGAEFTPESGPLILTIGVSETSSGPTTSCASQLWKPLVAGLPAEFAEAVVAGLLRRHGLLPSGHLRIDRAGYDVVESSPLAFELAAELMVGVIVAELAHSDVQVEVRRLVEAWP
jgi:hypothetical protein